MFQDVINWYLETMQWPSNSFFEYILPLLKYYWPFLKNSMSAVAEDGQFRVHNIF